MAAILLLSTISIQAQSSWSNTVGVYKIKVVGENLYVTLNTATGVITYEAGLPGNDDKQLFEIDNHPSGTNYSIKSVISGQGVAEAVDTGDTTPNLECRGNNAAASGQQDQWNLGRNSGTGMYLWSDDTGTTWSGAARRRVFGTPAAAGLVRCSASSDVAFEYEFISTLSADSFDSSSVFVSNPSSNRLNIKGLTSTINKINVYSLLGQPVLVRELKGERNLNLDISSLSNGVYVVNFVTENGSFTKKIVKQ